MRFERGNLAQFAVDPNTYPLEKSARFYSFEVREQFPNTPFVNGPVLSEESYADPISEKSPLEKRYGMKMWVQQGMMKSSREDLIWSDGFGPCSAIILRTPDGIGALIHAEPGRPETDSKKQTVEDVKRFLQDHPGTQMIVVRMITSSRVSDDFVDVIINEENVPVVKVIEVDNGNLNYEVAYDPQSDQIIFNQRSQQKLLTFTGFQG